MDGRQGAFPVSDYKYALCNMASRLTTPSPFLVKMPKMAALDGLLAPTFSAQW
jgi:hypothetical protein